MGVMTWLSAVALGLASVVGEPEAIRLDFERLPDGLIPSIWEIEGWGFQEGYRVNLHQGDARHSNRCATLEYAGELAPSGSGLFRVMLEPGEWQGKRVRLSAALRVAEEGAAARLRVLAHHKELGVVPIGREMELWVDSKDWIDLQMEGDVPHAGVTKLEVGIEWKGRGSCYLDDVLFEVAGAGAKIKEAEAARALEGRAAENLLALTQLTGLIRYFHPSDQALAADWEALTVAGVQAVEGAKSSVELAEMLEAHFATVAPTLRVYAKGRRPGKSSDALDAPKKGGWVVRLAHGVELELEGEVVGTLAQPGQAGLLESIRERVPIEGKRVPRGWTRPYKPSDYDLGGSCVARLATALYADENGTLPASVAEQGAAEAVASYGTGADRATRLAAVALAWSSLSHHSTLLQSARIEWEAEFELALTRAAMDAGPRVFLETLRSMLAAFPDGMASVTHPVGSSDSALPFCFAELDGELLISFADPDYGMGLQAGDVVEDFNGHDPIEFLNELCEVIPGATAHGVRAKALDQLSLRRREQRVSIRVQNSKGQKLQLSYRDEMERSPTFNPRPKVVDVLEGGVGYVDATRLVPSDLEMALGKVSGMDALIIDLRGELEGTDYGTWIGHCVPEPTEGLWFELPSVTRPYFEKADVNWRDERIDAASPSFPARRVFLVDARTRGHAECVAALAQRSRLGTLIGTPTAGATGSIARMDLPGGYKMQWTVARVQLAERKKMPPEGITPELLVERSREGIQGVKDEVLEAALMELSK